MKKYIVIIGGGESGTGAAVLAKKLGYEVLVTDNGTIDDKHKKKLEKYKILYEEGAHSTHKIVIADRVIKSPGIPNDVPILNALRKVNIPIISEIDFAAGYTKATCIGITGTNGKSTTTALTHHLMTNGGLQAGLAGNIGQSFALQVAEDDKPFYVLELSSFQLDDVGSFKPKVAVILNITPDHLDRYNNKMEQYVAAKFKITKNQDANDYLVYCADDKYIDQYLKEHEVKATLIPFSLKKKFYSLPELLLEWGQP